MSALLILMPVALFLGLLGLAAFLWSMRTGQFDDLDGSASRILFEEGSRHQARSTKVMPVKDKELDHG
jgi:cbb3-type cytochrome oxidase maturation protein